MNKFINLTLILLAFFLGVYKVSAARVYGWEESLLTPTIAFGANCTSSGCSNSGVTTNVQYDTFDSGSVHSFYYINSIYTAKDGFGMMWVFNTNNSFKTGYLYSIRTYVCNSSGATYNGLDISTANNAANTYAYTYRPLYSASVATNTLASETESGESCSYMTFYFVPSIDSQYVGIQFTTNTSVTTSQSLHGYTYDSLGLYTSELRNEIDNAIKDSNLATAEDIDKLNEEVKEMTSEQKQTNEKLDDVNDSLNYGDDLEFGDYEGSYVDDHNKQEADLLGSAHVNENIFNISIGTGSNSLIWDIVESAINSNAIVFSTIITMLSLGFIALVLNR